MAYSPKAAFQANRFKKTFTVAANEQFAQELADHLYSARAEVEADGGRVAPSLYKLEQTLNELLDRRSEDGFNAVEFEEAA